MNNEYGVFANIVLVATSVASAAAAIKLAFMKRARWQPPEEAVPHAVSRIASLVAMTVIGLLYVFGSKLGINLLAIVTVTLLGLTVISLSVVTVLSIIYSYYYPDKDEPGRKLGGCFVTKETARIRKEHPDRTLQMLFEDAKGQKDLLWPKWSQAIVALFVTLAFICLIGFGTSTLSAAATLVVVSNSSPKGASAAPQSTNQLSIVKPSQ